MTAMLYPRRIFLERVVKALCSGGAVIRQIILDLSVKFGIQTSFIGCSHIIKGCGLIGVNTYRNNLGKAGEIGFGILGSSRY